MTEHHDLESELQVSLHVNDQLRARIADLEAALKPIVDFVDDDELLDDGYMFVHITHLRAARAALEKK